jgi:hypothetical protein
MKTTQPAARGLLSDAEFHQRVQQLLSSLGRLSGAKRRAHLIKFGALNPDGTLRTFPMDHVPYGPRH